MRIAILALSLFLAGCSDRGPTPATSGPRLSASLSARWPTAKAARQAVFTPDGKIAAFSDASGTIELPHSAMPRERSSFATRMAGRSSNASIIREAPRLWHSPATARTCSAAAMTAPFASGISPGAGRYAFSGPKGRRSGPSTCPRTASALRQPAKMRSSASGISTGNRRPPSFAATPAISGKSASVRTASGWRAAASTIRSGSGTPGRPDCSRP